MPRRKILQILPAEPGWYARYVKGDSLTYSRVVVWASVRELTDSDEAFDHVMPFVAGPELYPSEADWSPDYAGVVFNPEWKEGHPEDGI